MVVVASSGCYDVINLTAAMRNAKIHTSRPESSMDSQLNSARQVQTIPPRTNNNNRRAERTTQNSQPASTRPTFNTFKKSSHPATNAGAILDSGTCASFVGKNTLDKTLTDMETRQVPDSTPTNNNTALGITRTAFHAVRCKIPLQMYRRA